MTADDAQLRPGLPNADPNIRIDRGRCGRRAAIAQPTQCKRQLTADDAAACGHTAAAGKRPGPGYGRQPTPQEAKGGSFNVENARGGAGGHVEPAGKPTPTDGKVKIVDEQTAAA